MPILKITKQITNEICKQNEQLPFYDSLIKYLEFLSESDRSEDEKIERAETLVNSFKINNSSGSE